MNAFKKQASKRNKKNNTKNSSKKQKKTNKTITPPKKNIVKKNAKSHKGHLWTQLATFAKNSISPLVVFIQALIILSVIVLFGVFYQLLVIFQFPESVIQSLPANQTIFAVEIAQKLPISQREDLIKNIPPETLNYILYFENYYLDQSYAQALRLVKPETKVYAKIQMDESKEDLFVFSFDKESKLQFLQVFKPFNLDWKAVFIDDNMYVSQSDELLNLLKNDYPSLSSNENFQDAYYNIPKQNFATAYLNMQLLNPQKKNIFGTTVASLRSSNEGMYLSTYTNPSEPEIKFYATQNKYQAELLEHLPSDPNYVLAGLEISQRFQYFLKQQGYQSSQLKSFFMAKNLGNSSQKFIQNLFENEVTLAIYEGGQYLLLSEALDDPSKVLEQVAHYQAYLNAKPKSHTLESGTIAKNLIPDYSQGYFQADENTYVFDLNTLPSSENSPSELVLYQQDTRYYLSNSLDLIQRVKAETRTFSSDLNPEPLAEMLSFADEFFYIDPSAAEKFITTVFSQTIQLPTQIKYPKIQSVGNYFLDGIQTVHLLKW